MSDIATATDAKLMEGPAFVRISPLAPLPPPIAASGVIGWLRQNLFSGAFNIALTVVCMLLILWIVPPLVRFLVLDAVWDGSSRADCVATAARPEVGACWAFIFDKISFLTYGFYPISERWRVDVFFALLAVGVIWMAWLDAPRRDIGEHCPGLRIRLGRLDDHHPVTIARTGGTGVPLISGVAYIWKTMNAAGTIHTASNPNTVATLPRKAQNHANPLASAFCVASAISPSDRNPVIATP